MAAAAANIHFMLDENLPARSERMGRYLEKRLREIEPKHKCVGFMSGMGLFWGVEIVRNQKTKEPFIKEDRNVTGAGDVSKWPSNFLQAKAMEKGVLLGGFSPNCIRLGPALTVTEQDIDKGVDALDYALGFLDGQCE